MFKYNLNKLQNYKKKFFLIISDFIIIIFSVVASYSLRHEKMYSFFEVDFRVYLLFLIIFYLVFYFNNIYQILIRYFDYFSIKKIIISILWGLVILLPVNFYLYKILYYPRSISIIAPVIIGIFIISHRIFLNFLINLKTRLVAKEKKILVLGLDKFNIELIKNIRQNPINGVIKALIDTKSLHKKREFNGIKIFKKKDLDDVIKKYRINEIIIGYKSLADREVSYLFDKYENENIRIRNLSVDNNYLQNFINKVLQPKINFFHIIDRPKISVEKSILEKKIKNKNILITGGGGSIGSHLCLEILKHSPKKIFILDNSEFNLFNIKNRIDNNKDKNKNISKFILGDFGDINFLRAKLKKSKIDEIYHAAAYKHLEFGEQNNYSIIKNNIFGTETLLNYVKEKGVKNFTFISSDKAVNPTSMLGFTKKYGEMLVKYFIKNNRKLKTTFTIVRFGNVIGSSGSVIPIFLEQVSQKKSLTVTHKNVERYFMSISEAVQLVINSSYLNSGGFKIFALDMGKQIKIYEIAKRIIRLSGYTFKNQQNKSGDIPIKITGLKKGEKISEELSLGKNLKPSKNSKILICEDDFDIKNLRKNLNSIRKIINSDVINYTEIRKLISS